MQNSKFIANNYNELLYNRSFRAFKGSSNIAREDISNSHATFEQRRGNQKIGKRQ